MRLILLLLLLPASLAGQGGIGISDTPLEFPRRTELLLLAPIPGAGSSVPSLRLRHQRRTGLLTSYAVSAVTITEARTRLAGVAVEGALALTGGRILVEPFMEAGAGWVDGRVEDGRYTATDSAGVAHEVIRYRAVEGAAAIAGAGVSGAAVLGGKYAARLVAGYWRYQTAAGGAGALRVGVGFGLAQRDTRWHTRAADRTPPTVVLGGALPNTDSLLLPDGVLRIVAADESGIAEVLVDGMPVGFWPADEGITLHANVEGPAVIALAPVRPGPGGLRVTAVVRDSAGVEREIGATVHSPADADPPAVSLIDALEQDRGGVWTTVRALAEDPSGLASATLNGCPLQQAPLDPGVAAALGLGQDARMVLGGAPVAGDRALLVVRDRAGNATRVERAYPAPLPPDPGLPRPSVADAEAAVSAVGSAGARSVRVRGRAADPVGAGIASVRIDGWPAPLTSASPEEGVFFDGWLMRDSAVDSIAVEVITRDGRRSVRSIPIGEPGSPSPGAFSALIIAADSPSDRITGAAQALSDMGAKAVWHPLRRTGADRGSRARVHGGPRGGRPR